MNFPLCLRLSDCIVPSFRRAAGRQPSECDTLVQTVGISTKPTRRADALPLAWQLFLRQTPALAVLAFDVLVRFRSICGSHFGGVPFQFFADAIRHVAEMIGFRQPAGIFKIAGRWFTRFAGMNPFLMMPQ